MLIISEGLRAVPTSMLATTGDTLSVTMEKRNTRGRPRATARGVAGLRGASRGFAGRRGAALGLEREQELPLSEHPDIAFTVRWSAARCAALARGPRAVQGGARLGPGSNGASLPVPLHRTALHRTALHCLRHNRRTELLTGAANADKLSLTELLARNYSRTHIIRTRSRMDDASCL